MNRLDLLCQQYPNIEKGALRCLLVNAYKNSREMPNPDKEMDAVTRYLLTLGESQVKDLIAVIAERYDVPLSSFG